MRTVRSTFISPPSLLFAPASCARVPRSFRLQGSGFAHCLVCMWRARGVRCAVRSVLICEGGVDVGGGSATCALSGHSSSPRVEWCVLRVSAVRLVWMCEECQQLVLSQSRCGPCVVPTVSVEAGGQ
eukprot:1718846-Rhodomonas_salina.1